MPEERSFYQQLLAVALAEAEQGLREGGVPVGAALCDAQGRILGRGRNRRVQENAPHIHGETDAFRNAGRLPEATGRRSWSPPFPPAGTAAG